MIRKRSRGFSLIELLIVIAVILIIAAIAVPSLVQSSAGKQYHTSFSLPVPTTKAQCDEQQKSVKDKVLMFQQAVDSATLNSVSPEMKAKAKQDLEDAKEAEQYCSKYVYKNH